MSGVFDAARDAAALDALVGAPSPSLSRFCALVSDWDARTDLTGAKDARALVEILCLDATKLAAESLVPRGARVVDVGSGAGAPILPLLLLRADLSATLVEPRRKRVAFLRTAIGSLPELRSRATVIESKVDAAAPRVVGMPFDLALARATFPPAEWLRIGLALAPRVVVLTAGDEPPAPPDAPVVTRSDYRVPSTGAPRRAIAYAKVERP